MNDKKLKTKQRVSALLLDENIESSPVLGQAETLLKKADCQSLYSDLLQLFVHNRFEEREAEQHWNNILKNYDYLADSLDRNVGLRVAIFDYFVNLDKAISSPLLVEIHVFRETEKLAMLDALTGIFNRRYFDIGLKKEITRSRRYGNDLSLLLIDLDDFKKINDTKGHTVGDDVLRKVATILQSISREEDIPCRYGGEEFAVVLPQTNTAGALTFAERLRFEVQADTFLGENAVTFSGGITTFPDGGECSSDLLKTADKAMYKAKFSGKDRCVLSSESEVGPTGNVL